MRCHTEWVAIIGICGWQESSRNLLLPWIAFSLKSGGPNLLPTSLVLAAPSELTALPRLRSLHGNPLFARDSRLYTSSHTHPLPLKSYQFSAWFSNHGFFLIQWIDNTSSDFIMQHEFRHWAYKDVGGLCWELHILAVSSSNEWDLWVNIDDKHELLCKNKSSNAQITLMRSVRQCNKVVVR